MVPVAGASGRVGVGMWPRCVSKGYSTDLPYLSAAFRFPCGYRAQAVYHVARSSFSTPARTNILGADVGGSASVAHSSCHEEFSSWEVGVCVSIFRSFQGAWYSEAPILCVDFQVNYWFFLYWTHHVGKGLY